LTRRTARGVWYDDMGSQLEVADPVEDQAYRLDGVFVTDFVLPGWFAGATTGDPVCEGTMCTFPGPLIAPADAPGPYDQMRVLRIPWQTPSHSVDRGRVSGQRNYCSSLTVFYG
jgi:hypothetical protein